MVDLADLIRLEESSRQIANEVETLLVERYGDLDLDEVVESLSSKMSSFNARCIVVERIAYLVTQRVMKWRA